MEKYRAEYNKLRYEHTFLKSEYEHLKADHKRILEELTLKHHAQASALQQERDEAIKAYEVMIARFRHMPVYEVLM